MATTSRRTYDTDSIVLRRIFVKNPTTNQQFSTNALLATSTNGSAIFVDAVSFFNSLGFPTSDTFPSTVAGLGTAGYISTPGGGSGDVTKANLVSTVEGLGTAGYISVAGGGSGDVTKANLVSTVVGLGTTGYLSTLSLSSTIQGLGTLNYISLATLNSTLASTVAGIGGGDVTRFNLASTVAGLGTVNYISLATLNSTLASTVAGLGTGSGDVTKANLISSIEGLATTGYISSSQLFSSIRGISVLNSISTLSSLIVSSPTAQLNILMAGATIGTYILNSITVGVANSDVTSTTQGLGTLDYISIATLNSTLASTVAGINVGTGITQGTLNSTIEGLGTLNYISLATLNSTLASTVAGIGPGGGATQGALTSSIEGLGTLNYISVATLNSTLASTVAGINLGTGITVADQQSSLTGLGSLGYISLASLVSTVGGINLGTGITVADQQSSLTGLGSLGYISLATLDSTLASTVAGIGPGGGITQSALTSSLQGLGSLNYISTPSLNSTLASTVRGLGTVGYVSSSTLFSTVTGLGRIYASVGFFQSNLSSFSTSIGRNFYASTVTASTVTTTRLTTDLLTVSTISFGAGTGFLAFTNLRAQYISSFSTQTDVGLINTFISGPQAKFSSFEGDGSQLRFLSVGLQNALPSTTIGLGTLGYISAAQLISTTFGITSNYSTFISATLATYSFPYSGEKLFLNYSQTVSPYYQLGVNNIIGPSYSNVFTVPLNSSDNFVVGFQSDFYMPTFLATGLWSVNIFAEADNQGALLYASLFQRTPGGIESFIGSSSNSPFLVPLTKVQLDLLIDVPYTNIDAGNTLVLKIFANNTTNQNRTLKTYYEDGNYSSVDSTLPTTVQNINVFSSLTGLGTLGYVSSSQLVSTVEGLGTLNYISVATLNSTLASTVGGIANTSITAAQIISTVATTGYLSTIPSTILVENLRIIQSTPLNPVAFITISSMLGGEIKIQSQLLNLEKTYVTTSTLIEFADLYGTTPSTALIANGSGKLTLGFRPTTNPIESGIRFYDVQNDIFGTPYDTTFNPIPFTNISSLAISTSFLSTGQGFALNGQNLFLSTNTSTLQKNLYVNDKPVGSYNPVRVITSTLGAANVMYLNPEDIGKYFLITTGSASANVYLPTIPDPFMDGWNAVIKNMATSAYNLTVETTATTTLSPGLATTVVMDGNNSYSL